MRRLDEFSKAYIIDNACWLANMVAWGMDAENGCLQESDAYLLYNDDIITKQEYRAIDTYQDDDVYQKVLRGIHRALSKYCPDVWEKNEIPEP